MTVCNPVVDTAAAAVKKLSKKETCVLFISGKDSTIPPSTVYVSTVWAIFWCGVKCSRNTEYFRMDIFKNARVFSNTFFQLIAIYLYYIKWAGVYRGCNKSVRPGVIEAWRI